jgi:hypothetical protein
MVRLFFFRTVLCTTLLCLLTNGSSVAQEEKKVNTGVISGVVVDQSGSPVGDAEVDADSGDSSGAGHEALRLALTDSSGGFAFDPIKFGTYKFYALKPGASYPDTKFEIYVESYHKATATISPTSPNAFVKIVVGPKAGVVKLKVVDKLTRTAVPNPTFVLSRPDTGVWVSTSRSDDSSILVPPAVPTKLTVRAEGYASWTNQDRDHPEATSLLKIESGAELQMTVELESIR